MTAVYGRQIRVYMVNHRPLYGYGSQLTDHRPVRYGTRMTVPYIRVVRYTVDSPMRECGRFCNKILSTHILTAFTLSPRDGDLVSPCLSILVTVERQKGKGSNSSALRALGPHSVSRQLVPTHSLLTNVRPQLSANSQSELENETNRGYNALSRYRKHGEKRDLEHSVERFKRALRICPENHPCRAAAQSNLAMAEFILCQVENRDTILPLELYHDALEARSVGHVDRPSTLIQLATVHFARFKKSRDEVDGARAEALLREVVELSSAESHENRVAGFMLKLVGGRRVGSRHQNGQSLVEQDSPLRLTNDDLEI